MNVWLGKLFHTSCRVESGGGTVCPPQIHVDAAGKGRAVNAIAGAACRQ